MKIIEKGTGPTEWAIEQKCTGNGDAGCGATLLVERSDLFETTSSARGETTRYTTFECAQCKVWSDVADSKVPPHVRSGLPHRAPS